MWTIVKQLVVALFLMLSILSVDTTETRIFSMKSRYIKTTVSATLVLLTSFFLIGCTQPKPSDDIVLNLDTETVQTTAPATKDEMQTTQSVKTLADFKTIEASQVTLTTSKGPITFEIYTDKVPLTAQNFLNLAADGFYNGIVFHRVIADFMAQAGDPLTKDPSQKNLWGTGGPGYTIADEFDASLKHDSAGVVSMANTGQPNSGGSQFFITFGPTEWLDGKHAVFGKVTSGLEVLTQITQGDTILSVSYQ
jgi:peptidyl-prolyl cis-trans isomerase B (cyclophilin B)